MDKHFILVYFLSLIIFSTALKIKNIIVPPIQQLDENKSVILDCDFDAENDTTGLVVKWFLDDQAIYQWIMNHEPQEVGLFKGKLDLSYKATNDITSMYRALKIKHLSLDLAGEYKCVVFNYIDEDSKSKRMIIVNGPEKLEMLQLEGEEEDQVSISCSAYGIFPEPAINITYSGSNIFNDIENQSIQDDEDRMYNVTQIVTMRADELEDLTEFVCELSFPDTNFTIDKKLTFIPDNASITTPTWIILLTTLTTLMSTLLST